MMTSEDAFNSTFKHSQRSKTQDIKFDEKIDINLIDFEADKAVQRLIYIPGIRKKINKKLFKWLNINQ